MPKFVGYTIITKIHEGIRTEAYRAVRQSDQSNVIIKVSRAEYPALEGLASLQNEYNLVKVIEFPGVVRVLDLVKHDGRLALVLEDINGITLKRYIHDEPVSLDDFFRIAIALADTITQLHNHGIVHKDIKPSNIIIDPASLLTKLTDFSISSQLSKQGREQVNPNKPEGSLAYMSPEQTGRTNRMLDYRTDFYSLGVTFYEMLTGHLPFNVKDPNEIIYSQLAKVPPAITTVNPEVPDMVSAIVEKLMAKNSEERYQSGQGLKADLNYCYEQWVSHHYIPRFELGQNESRESIQISQKIYGRDREVEQLLTSFHRVSRGGAEILLVTGESGVGKSSLVEQVQKPIVKQNGYFISGKFEQLERNIPYSAVIKAFKHLINQLLTKPEDFLKKIAGEIVNALDKNAQVIIDLIPELELIIGKQPSVPQLHPLEAQNRIQIVFQNFIRVLARAEHPLVIFIDDLHWADAASLKLIDLIYSDPNDHYLLLIGAYRSGEVHEGHPINNLIQELKKKKVAVETIQLYAITQKDINQMVADTLGCRLVDSEELSRIIFQKTNGNPFFINEFILAIYKEGILHYSNDANAWEWDIAKVQEKIASENVIDILINNIENIQDEIKNVLKIASCIGNAFSLNLLTEITELSYEVLLNLLWRAVQENLIVSIGDTYKSLMYLYAEKHDKKIEEVYYRFVHDKVQGAFYHLIPLELKQKIHLKIGRFLLSHVADWDVDEKIFDILNHFNQAISLIDDPKEKLELANLNLRAGARAKESAAYEQAKSFFQSGLFLLDKKSWDTQYEVIFSLYRQLTECEYLTGEHAKAEEHFNVLLKYAKTPLDKASILDNKIILYAALNRNHDAIKQGLQALKLLGLDFPEHPSLINVFLNVVKLYIKVRFRSAIKIFRQTKEVKDEKLLMIWQIINHILFPCYQVNRLLYGYITFRGVLLTLQQGYTVYSSTLLLTLGAILINRMHRYDAAFKFVKISKAVQDKYNDPAVICENASVVATLINHWRYHAVTNLEYFKLAYENGVESGNLVFAAMSKMGMVGVEYAVGAPLSRVEHYLNEAIDFTDRVKSFNFRESLLTLKYTIKRLQDINYHEPGFEELLSELRSNENKINLRMSFSLLSQLYFLFGDYPQALHMSQEVDKWHPLMKGTLLQAGSFLFYALSMTYTWNFATLLERRQYKRRLKQIVKELEIWAKQCPDNYEHKYLILAAEIARIENKSKEAEDLYDKAIQSAEKYDFVNFYALACELAARFFVQVNKPRLAKVYFQDAHYAYLRWGAKAKAAQLEEEFPDWFKPSTASTAEMITTAAYPEFINEIGPYNLDIKILLKAIQALSSEIVLENLLKKLMKIVLEGAGAQRAVLIMRMFGQWFVEAEIAPEKSGVVITHDLIEARIDLPKTVLNFVIHTKEHLILNNAALSDEYENDPFISHNHIKSILVVPVMRHEDMIGALYLENNLTVSAFSQMHMQLIKTIATQAAISLENAYLYNACDQFVPYEFLRQLGKRNLVEVKLGDQIQRNLTILFCDIRSFTAMSENLSPEQTFHFINEFISHMEPTIKQYHGFIDKYIGDAIMALFPEEPDDALRAAINMHKNLAEFNRQRADKNLPSIEIGVGINSGDLMLGIIGDRNHIESSVIGDAVNVASRVESLTKIYGVGVIITDDTKTQLRRPKLFRLRMIDEVAVKGRLKPIAIWEVCDIDPQDVWEMKISSLPDFEQARKLLKEDKKDEARKLFEKCLLACPGDKVTNYYLKKITGK